LAEELIDFLPMPSEKNRNLSDGKRFYCLIGGDFDRSADSHGVGVDV
jgi:hypothetical protein